MQAARGLLTENKVLFGHILHLTPEGEKIQSQLKSDLFGANDILKLLKSDPAQAAAAAIGTTILLSNKLPKHFKPLADAMRANSGDAAYVPFNSTGSGIDWSSFDLGSSISAVAAASAIATAAARPPPVAIAKLLCSDSPLLHPRENPMRKQLALFAIFAFMLSIISVQAMPAAALKGATNGQVTQVRDGCGPYRWRGPHGHCHHF